MKLPTLSIVFPICFSCIIDSFSGAFYDDGDRYSANSRRKVAGSNYKTTGGQSFKFDWTNKRACHFEDPDAACRSLENGTTCFGSPIPYTQSSWRHLEALNWHGLSSDHLEQFAVYAGLPECWRLLRDLLCAVFYPPCKDGYVLRVPRSLCLETKAKCSFLVQHDLWPNAFGDCTHSNETAPGALDNVFTNDCKIPRNMVWPAASACIHPFTLTDFKTGWLFDHCALNCTGVRIDLSQPIQSLLMIGLSGIFIFTLLTAVLLFLEDNDDATRVPYFWPLFWFSIYHLFFLACWLVQMFSGAYTTCREDGSIRLREPSSAGVWCSLQYIILLGSTVGASFWIVLFAYMHYLWRRKPNRCSFSPYQHVVVWPAASVMITGGFATSQVDSDPILSVCFFSKASIYGVLWYTVPLLSSSFVALVLFLLSVICFMRQNIRQPEEEGTSGKRVPSVAQVGVLLSVLSTLYFVSVALVLTDVLTVDGQQRAVDDYVLCKLRQDKEGGDPRECHLVSDGTVRLAQLHVLLMSLPALAVDVWMFVCADLRRRLLRYCPRRKSTEAAATNGDIVMTQAPDMASGNRQEAARPDEQRLNQSHRTSWTWSSSSSIADPGAVSEPESRSKKRAFINRLKHRPAYYRENARSMSSNSIAVCSIKTPPSLKSGTLPSGVMTPASPMNGMPFPDLSQYPLLPSSASNGWWPFTWPYSAWPWLFYCQHPSAFPNGQPVPVSPMTPSGPQATQPSAQSISAASTTPLVQEMGTGQDPLCTVQSAPVPPANVPPVFWPMAFPPMAPYWPPAAAAMPADCTVNGRSAEQGSRCGRTSTTEKIAEECEERVSENAPKKSSYGDESPSKKQRYEDEEEESVSSEEEDRDSDEVDPEEEAFVEEQLRSLLGNGESRS